MSLSFSLQVSFSLCLFVSLFLTATICLARATASLALFKIALAHPARSPHRLFKIVSPKPPQALQDRLTKATASPESWI